MLQLESQVQRIRFVKELRYDPEACNRGVSGAATRGTNRPAAAAGPSAGRDRVLAIRRRRSPEPCLITNADTPFALRTLSKARGDARPPYQGFGRPITFSLPTPLAPSPCPLNTRSTASTTSETEIRFIQRKSIGHSRKKQGLHST